MSLKEQVTIEDVAETVTGKEEVVEQETEQTINDEYGFIGEYGVDDYTTITGKEYKDTSNATAYNIGDFDIGEYITGSPEVTIFENNDKDDDGKYVKNYQLVRVTLWDANDSEYVNLYANIPRKDTNGFIEKLNKGWKFMRGGFDLCFSFMRWVDETNVVTSKGEEINRIPKINIQKICEKIDSMDFVKVKVIKGTSEDYPSFIILDMGNY